MGGLAPVLPINDLVNERSYISGKQPNKENETEIAA